METFIEEVLQGHSTPEFIEKNRINYMEKRVLLLLKFMMESETNNRYKRFDFYHGGTGKYGMDEPNCHGDIIWVGGDDLPTLKRYIKIDEDDLIKRVLISAYNSKFTISETDGLPVRENQFCGLILSEKGREYLKNYENKRVDFRKQILLNIGIAVVSALATAIANYYINRTEINVLQTQIVEIKNQISV